MWANVIQIIFDPSEAIRVLGLIGVLVFVFAESGLFFGFFLPGDSLLFTAGFFASQGEFSLAWLIIGVAICAIAGDNVGYAFGKRVGRGIFYKEDSIFFKKKHLEHTKNFYNKYGGKTIILARFVPVVRTFAPILAGVGEMDYKTFFFYNMIGGIIWSVLIPSIGFFLGELIPNIDGYLLPIICVIIFVSFVPVIMEFWNSRKDSQSNPDQRE